MLQSIEEILGILAAVAALALLSRKVPIPYPILLVLGGLALALIPGSNSRSPMPATRLSRLRPVIPISQPMR